MMQNTSSIYIRPATISDKDFITSLVPRLIDFGPPAWRQGDQMVNFDIKILSDKLANPNENTAIFIAHDDDDVPMGFVHVHAGEDFYNKEEHGHISDLIVAPEGQGKGIGKLLLASAEEWARSKGYHWISLSVFAQNTRARDVYEHLGYGPDMFKYVKQLD